MTISIKSKVSGGGLVWSHVDARHISDFIFLSYYTIHISNSVFSIEKSAEYFGSARFSEKSELENVSVGKMS